MQNGNAQIKQIDDLDFSIASFVKIKSYQFNGLAETHNSHANPLFLVIVILLFNEQR